jgi:GR25 family glycosyltransferase involved in LPS biosynthesis
MEGNIHVYCINLKHRVDRWERFSAQPELQRLKSAYEFERFEGVNGSAVNIQKDERISLRTKRNIKQHIRRDHEELDSAGGVGCYLSHTTVWKKFLERSEPYAMILEDDAILHPGFTAEFQRAMKKDTSLLPDVPDVWFFSAPSDWYYEYKGTPFPPTMKQYTLGPWITKSCAPFTGYLISRRGAERLLENAFPIDMHVDLYTCLNADLGKILAVSHTNVAIGAYNHFSSGTLDSDIRVESDDGCPICDIPTHFRKKGIIIVNMPIVLVGFLGLAGLWYIYSMRRR